jgi:hypothetical protein
LPGTDQIDLDQADSCLAVFFLLLEVQLLAWSRHLVGRTLKFDRRNNSTAGTRFAYFHVGFRHRFVNLGLGDRDAVERCDGAGMPATGFNNAHVRVDAPPRTVGRFHKDSLFDAGHEVRRKSILDGIARVRDQTGMDIAPEALQIRIHAGERACHTNLRGQIRRD